MSASGLRFALAGLLAAALLYLPATPAAGQGAATGALQASVTIDGVPARDVLVTLRPSPAGDARAVSTDAAGDAHFTFVVPGDYEVLVEKLGFVPRLVTAVPVRPGQTIALPVSLHAAETGTPAREESAWTGVSRVGDAWIPAQFVRNGPFARHTLLELDRLSSMPVRGLAIDGMRVDAPGGSLFDAAPDLALHGAGSALALREPSDVEWGRGATSLLSVHTRADAAGADVAAEWSGSALPGASFADDVDSFNEFSARASVRSALFGEGSSFALGVEARRVQEPVAAAWSNSTSAGALVALAAERDIELGDRIEPAVAYDEAFSGFVGAHLPLSERHRLRLSAHASLLPRLTRFDAMSGLESEVEGHDALASASLSSTFAPGVTNELRAGFTTGKRETEASAWTASVHLVEDALSFGPLQPGASATASTLELSDALHFRSGAHTLKLGVAGRRVANEVQHRAGGAGEYYFSSVDAMRADSGVYVRSTGPAAGTEWTDLSFALFAQDTWRVFSGVEVQAGVRAEHVSLPVDDVRRDEEWLRLSGVASDVAPGGQWLLSPRAVVRWDPQGDGRWLVQANGGIYHDTFDPLLISQWVLDDGSGRVRRVIGSTGWPTAPASGDEVRRLTFPGSSFAPARTARVSAGIGRALAPGTTLEVTGSFGRTTHLPRRTDLNALLLPVARDQYERPVYGVLVQQGGILAAEPGTGRRFPEYDEVATISADGGAEQWSITASLERQPVTGLGVLARYTFARATDDWFGGAEGGWVTTAPAGLPDDWLDARSDLDIPHRAALGLLYDTPIGLRLGALYSYHSGRPFTPGFRAGVDANGDGVVGNDPAFIDPTVPGMQALVGEWSCLADDAGAFAARNGCRTAAVQRLDLRAEFTVFRFGGGAAAVALEAFDIFESAPEVPDAALYLVDPDATLVRDEEARTVTVPLVINEDFGTPLTRRHPGRKLRLGVSLNW